MTRKSRTVVCICGLIGKVTPNRRASAWYVLQLKSYLFVHTPSAQNQIDLGVRLIPSVRTQTADWLTDEGSLDGRAR